MGQRNNVTAGTTKKEFFITDSWDQYLEELPREYCDIYYRQEYAELCKLKDDITECFIYRENGDIFLFPYLKRKVEVLGGDCFDFESPYGYGGPISNTDDEEFLKSAVDTFKRLAKKNKIIAGFVRFHPLLNNSSLVHDYFGVFYSRNTVAMRLDENSELIWKEQTHVKHRNSIRKAEKLGLKFAMDTKLSHLEDFRRLYDATMRRKAVEEYYYFDDAYFKKLKKMKDQCVLGIVRFKNKIIAAALFFKFGIYGHYHLAGSNIEYLTYAPNNFLLYKAAMYLKDEGVRIFHLGGGNSESPEDKLFKFKKRFSKYLYPFYLGKFLFDEDKYNLACQKWAKDYPDKVKDNDKLFLKYRILD